jgi:exopolysaccharide biosynthesis polyprenyl glycosylphosphotransferase
MTEVLQTSALQAPALRPLDVQLRTRAPQRLGPHRDLGWRATRLATDAVLLAGAATIATVASPLHGAAAGGIGWPLLFGALVVALSTLHGTYAPRMRIAPLDDVRQVARDVAIPTMAVVMLRALLGNASQGTAEEALRLGVFAAVYLAAGRVALDVCQTQARQRGEAVVPTLIIGAGRIGRMTAKRLLEHPELGLAPIGFLDKEPQPSGDGSLPVLGASWDFDRIVRQHDIGQVIVTFSTAPNEVLLRIVRSCEDAGIGVSLVPRLFEKVTEKLTIEHLGGLPLLTAHPTDPKGWQFAVKYALDRVLAALLLVVLAPLMLAGALAVRLSLGRPILFRQLRIGQDGRSFDMLKLRTMRPIDDAVLDAETLPDDTAPGGVEGGDRRTRVGAFLRKSSLDELPQLFNVLKGEMSLVGPRPERPEFVELFEPRVYRYGDRHRVKSGITGWAQTNGLRGNTSLSDRVEWDNYYIENWSLWLDLKIMMTTLPIVARYFRNVT